MTDKALVTRRGGLGTEASRGMESNEAQGMGLTVEGHLSHATLVSGTAKQYAEMEAQGFRVASRMVCDLLMRSQKGRCSALED